MLIFKIIFNQNLCSFKLFLLAQKVDGHGHILITSICCADIGACVSMQLTFLGEFV